MIRESKPVKPEFVAEKLVPVFQKDGIRLATLFGSTVKGGGTPRVETLLSTLDEAMGQLRRLGGRFASFEEFKADVDTRELCVHYLRIALESVLDVCRHFLAVVGVSLAELDTTNLIELAGEKGLL